MLLERADRARNGSGPGLLGADLGGDGSAVSALHVPPGERFVSMDGQEVFRRATRALVASCAAALDDAGASPDSIDLFVPHQANPRIIEATARRLGLADGAGGGQRRPVRQHVGGVGAHRAGRGGRGWALTDGTRVLLSGVGAGMAWATVYLRWGT